MIEWPMMAYEDDESSNSDHQNNIQQSESL